MKSPQLKGLIDKLNSYSRKAFENAAGICLRNTHYSVEIEHLLYSLLQQKETQFMEIIKYYGVSDEFLFKEIAQQFKNFKVGNTRTPALSEFIVEWTKEAWSLASLELNTKEITTGHLLYALFSSPVLDRFRNLFKAFDKISKDHLCAHFLEITKDIPESHSPSLIQQSINTQALTQFTVDLTEQARLGKIDPVIGRDVEIRQIIDILMRRKQNNPLLVGEAGVGKTAIAEGLALKIIEKSVPPELENVSLRLLDLALLQAGASIKGEFENRLKNLITEVKQSPVPIILFIDEAHTLIGAGGQAGQGDAANLLKPALARGEFRTIAATTWSEYKKYIDKDPALTRRFQLLTIEEPSLETSIRILEKIKPLFEKYHKVKIHEEALSACVNLTQRYIPERKLPDKAISLLDTACAKNHIDHKEEVNAEDLASIIESWTGIPISRLLEDEITQTLNLKENLQNRIVGQDKAINTLTNAIQISRAKLNDPHKPIGVFLLLGKSGVGKTETAHAISEFIFGDSKSLLTFNMSEFKEPYKISMLTGSPAGYVGYGEGGILTEAVRRRPYGVLLLDEIDKAHPSIQDIFYQIFDKGALRDSEGRWIDFRNTLILMTANHADHFKPALMARMTLVPYNNLDKVALYQIIEHQLDAVKKRIQQNYHAELEYNVSLKEYIFNQCKERPENARYIQSVIQNELLPLLSTTLLKKIQQQQKINKIKIFINRAKKLSVR
jgi:ATP-dependent Clp protease ATP-binding subunit ClpA